MKRRLEMILNRLEAAAFDLEKQERGKVEMANVVRAIHYQLQEIMNTLPPDRTTSMEITAMTRDATKNSGSPFWRCATSTGIMVNVFQHDDPLKDTFHLFDEAGFAAPMIAMKYGQTIGWQANPLTVDCIPNGNFWNVVSVVVRRVDQNPDPDDDNEPEPF